MYKLSIFGNIICYFSSKRFHFITFTEEVDHILVLTFIEETHIDGHLLNEFFFHLTLSVLEKLKNSIFEIPEIKQTLNINN